MPVRLMSTVRCQSVESLLGERLVGAGRAGVVDRRRRAARSALDGGRHHGLRPASAIGHVGRHRVDRAPAVERQRLGGRGAAARSASRSAIITDGAARARTARPVARPMPDAATRDQGDPAGQVRSVTARPTPRRPRRPRTGRRRTGARRSVHGHHRLLGDHPHEGVAVEEGGLVRLDQLGVRRLGGKADELVDRRRTTGSVMPS